MNRHGKRRTGLLAALPLAVALSLAGGGVLAGPAAAGSGPDGPDGPDGHRATGDLAATTWPGGQDVVVADDEDTFGKNLSGLSFGDPNVLWAVDNGPGRLYRLVVDGSVWSPDPSDGWSSGKALHYGDGSGDPDAEGVVAGPDGVFAATERDNDDDGTSRQEILRYDTSSSASSLDATGAWDLTGDLPEADANTGIEGISWLPDSYLTAHGFLDDTTGAAYDPSRYQNHGTGLYAVGSESDGTVHVYALDLSGSGFTRVATVASGLPAVMDLEFEPESGHLWAACDDTCDGRSATLDVGSDGKLAATATYDRPSGLANLNDEGFTIAPSSTCSGGHKLVFWSDDYADDGHALRAGTLPCGSGTGGGGTGGGSGGGTRSCQVPADVLDLTNWYEGLPVGEDGDPQDVHQPELATYRSDPWFTTTADCSGVQFRAAVDGVTTSGSSYPRSELREMDGSDKASWSSTSGTHTMVIQEAITHVPDGRPNVVAGQIHGADDDLSVFRLEGSNLYVTKGDDPHYALVTSDYRLGTAFEAKFVVSDGTIRAYYDGALKATIDGDFDGAYFKAGAYTQANCDNADPCSDDNYGEVVVSGLTVTHTA